MSNNKLHDEIYCMFADQLPGDLQIMEQALEDIGQEQSYKENISTLFRIFHNFKATCNYLGLIDFFTLVKKTEDILSALREQPPPIDSHLLRWLCDVKEQFVTWNDEIQLGLSHFSKADPKLLKEVVITPPVISPSEQLKQCSVVYLDTSTQRASKVVEVLQPFVGSIKRFDLLPDCHIMPENEQPDVCIINMNEETEALAKISRKLNANASVIAIFDKPVSHTRRLKLSLGGINHTLQNPIRAKPLLRELLSIASTNFSNRRLLVTEQKILDFIETLQPLRDSIFKVQQICDDEELPVKELVKVIRQDPTFSATVLSAARNPIYGIKHISTIDQAVTTFGKRTIKALVLNELNEALLPVDFSLYGIDEETYSKVAAMRLQLMLKWYKKVSISALSILSSTAVLGNIGQLLLTQEADSLEDPALFTAMCREHSIQQAEEHFFHTSTAFVSADILSHWKLQEDIVDAIRFSDYPQTAPDDIRSYCVANHIVYRLIGLDGTLTGTLSKDIQKLMKSEKLETAPLEQALQTLK